MFNADTPIHSSNEDLLNRADFSEQLAKAILSYNQRESFNIGLYGEWGSGKTSVINMVEESIFASIENEDNKPTIIKFNPWLFADQGQLTVQFFKQFSSAYKTTEKTASAINSIGTAMESLGAAFELTSLIPMVGGAGTLFGKAVQSFGKQLTSKSQTPDIQSLKNDVVRQLRRDNFKTIIIMDDIDRLSNYEIRSVFQLIKSIADFPNTIYLLAFDYDIVSRALTDVQNTDGERYLEKIIQVPFHLPELNDAQLEGLFIDGLNQIIGEEDIDFDKGKWSLLFQNGIKPYLKTVRDVRRLLNTFSLKYAFLKNETEFVDLLGITTVQVFLPNFFTTIPLHKEMFCGNFSQSVYGSNDEREKFKNAYQSITENLAEVDQKNLIEILSMLFPKIASVFRTGGYYSPQDWRSSIRLGNIYNSTYFDRYFSLSFKNSLSLSMAKRIVFSAGKETLATSLLEIDSNNQTGQFLLYFDSIVDSLKGTDEHTDRIIGLLVALLENWNKLHDEQDKQLFTYPWQWRLQNIVEHSLLVITAADERFEIAKSIFANKNIDLSTRLQILQDLEHEHGRFGGEKKSSEEIVLSLEHVLILESMCFDEIRKLIDENDVMNQTGLPWIRMMIENSDSEEIKKSFAQYMATVIETDIGLAKVISSLVGHGKGASTFVFDTWNMDLESMGKYFDVESAVARMSTFTHNDEFMLLNVSIREDIWAFLTFYEERDGLHRESVTRIQIESFAKRKLEAK